MIGYDPPVGPHHEEREDMSRSRNLQQGVSRRLFGLAGLGCALLCAPAASAALFTNGGFELPAVPVASDRTGVSAGGFFTGADGWQSTNFAGANSGNAIYSKASANHSNDFVKPSQGNQFVALNLTGGTSNMGGVQQVFDTVSGQAYTVTFDYSAISNGDNSIQRLSYEVDNGNVAATTAVASSILASGQASRDTTGVGNLTTPALTTVTFNFTAASDTSTIRFVSLTSPPSHNAFGPVIDNVTVSVAPEPGSLALAAIAASVIASRRGRRRTA
jgi:hypothetical protein